MNYFSIVLICIILILFIASIMYILGRKISYNFILYNAVTSLGIGVIFFLVKITFFESRNSIEGIADIGITIFLLFVWIIALFETIIVAVFDHGNENKTLIKNKEAQSKMLNLKLFKSMPNNAIRFGKDLILRLKER